MPGSRTSSIWHETDGVAGLDLCGLISTCVPHDRIGPADEVPAARRRRRVNGRLPAGDGDAARRYALTWRVETLQLELAGQLAEVREAGREAEHVSAVDDRSVNFDHLRRRQAAALGHRVEVGAC